MLYLAPDQILEGRCYQLRADNGAHIIARVHEIREGGGVEMREHPSEAPVARILIRSVRFYWRKAGGEWSSSLAEISLEAFASRAEKEMPCE
jgi:hypothetical protein